MLALTDNRIMPSSLLALKEEGFKTILLPPASYLQPAVASHTDMLIFIGFGRIFCHRRFFGRNKELLEHIASLAGAKLEVSDEPTGEKYPLDVLFNACLIGNKLICNEKTVSRHILSAAKENHCETVSVSQGYTKCSVCVVSDNAIVTADKGIAKACLGRDIDVLEISEGHISLPPYDFGFIGGASGIYGDKVYFCGSLDNHPDGEKIKDFCKKHKKIAISLGNGELQDVGSLFFI